MDSGSYEHGIATLSTTPLLLSYDTQSSSSFDNQEVDGVATEARRYDILLIPYMLSYSAYFPCLISPLIRLFEKALVPTWMSHYTLSIGDYHFDLYREGKLPFASIAYFRVVHENDLMQMKNAFHEGRRWTGLGLKLGTTNLGPGEIVRKVEDQDKIYKQNNTSASNCLIGVPREYSLLQANCQHFILELIRRISPQFGDTEDTWTRIQRESTRPRLYCHLFLSCAGLTVNLLVALLPLHFYIVAVAIFYHYMFSMVMLQDYMIRKHRAELIYNEQRYLGFAGFNLSHYPAHYNSQEPGKRYWTKPVLMTVWMAWPLTFGIYPLFLEHGLWVIGFITVAAVAYCICICVPAYFILVLLKSRNQITQLRKRERLQRFNAAYLSLEDRWYRQDHSCVCSVCHADEYETNRTYFLKTAVCDIETTLQPFGEQDLDRAITRWESRHRSGKEIVFLYKWKAMLLKIAGIIALLLWLTYVHWSPEHQGRNQHEERSDSASL